MWGEFEDDKEETSDRKVTRKCVNVNKCVGLEVEKQNETGCATSAPIHHVDNTDDTLLQLPLCERLLHHLASGSVTVKSQQRYEPDLTYQERKDILSALLKDKPGQFLYRFGKHLRREHLQYFLAYEGDPEVDHYLGEAQKHLNAHTAKIRVRNRRYAALERLRREGDYFSEKEMERRDPLLYDQLITRHQTQQERQEKQSAVDKSDLSFSSILLEHIDYRAHMDLHRRQEEEEDDMLEEGDSDEEEEEKEDDEEHENEDGEGREGEKRLYREEFYSACYSSFLRGRHTDFDYGQVDASDEYDLLEIRARDEEESYFDQESSNDSLSHTTTNPGHCKSPGENLMSHAITGKYTSSTGNPVMNEERAERAGEDVVEEMDEAEECDKWEGKQMTDVGGPVNSSPQALGETVIVSGRGVTDNSQGEQQGNESMELG